MSSRVSASVASWSSWTASSRPGPAQGAEVLERRTAGWSPARGSAQGLLDRQLGEGPHDLVRGHRVGRADDARVVPGMRRSRPKGFSPAGRSSAEAAAVIRRRIGMRMRCNHIGGASRRVESGPTRDATLRAGRRPGVETIEIV